LSDNTHVSVLVVDDEPDALFLFKVIFEREGYVVVQAAHGAEALEQLEIHPVDIIVTDLMMPVMDGAQLIDRLRSDPGTSRIPIVLVSANPNSELGADAVLGKPFRPTDILRVVGKLVESVRNG
jgi:CheY-like chemotaxis protein